jgi:hypothetical protein
MKNNDNILIFKLSMIFLSVKLILFDKDLGDKGSTKMEQKLETRHKFYIKNKKELSGPE